MWKVPLNPTNQSIVILGSSGIIYIDPTSLRRSATLPAVATATNLPTNQDNHPVTMTTTVNQLSRAFGVVVRQIADLLMMLQDYHALVPNLSVVLDISSTEVLELQVTYPHTGLTAVSHVSRLDHDGSSWFLM